MSGFKSKILHMTVGSNHQTPILSQYLTNLR